MAVCALCGTPMQSVLLSLTAGPCAVFTQGRLECSAVFSVGTSWPSNSSVVRCSPHPISVALLWKWHLRAVWYVNQPAVLSVLFVITYDGPSMHQQVHKNFVRCLGVCVMPPSICMVSEYMAKGSLFHVLTRYGVNGVLCWCCSVSIVVLM